MTRSEKATPHRVDPSKVPSFRLMHATAPGTGPSKTSRVEIVIEAGVGAPAVVSRETWEALLSLAKANGFVGHNVDEKGGALKPSEVRALRRAIEQGTTGLLAAAGESVSMNVWARKAVE